MTQDTNIKAALQQRSIVAFVFSVPIAILGGLIGLGGAEFRLPVLAGPLRYPAKQAVPLNLAVSLITVVVSLLTRLNTLPPNAIGALSIPIVALIAGAVFSAFFGAALASRLSEQRIEQIILILLLAIGAALIIEAFIPQSSSGFVPPDTLWRAMSGILFGLVIGLISSLLGVAGGELIIPTLIFAFGADVNIAGTASLLISFPTIVVGLVRYAQRGAFIDRVPLRETVAPMGVGSVIGAIIGGILVGVIPAPILKFLLGIILIVSALRIFRNSQSHRQQMEFQ